MSKSYENAIYLRDRGADLRKKVESMFTDPQRMTKKDPGRPELCNVFTFHGIYSPEQDVKEIETECRRAGIGCVECKRRLADRIIDGLRPIHERQDHYLGTWTRCAASSKRAAAGRRPLHAPRWKRPEKP
jgi:tryptophanyl-tRNA synthetase